MKKTILSLLVSVSATLIQAQTLTSSQAPVPGDVHRYREDTLQIAPGSPGQGQTWNFASLVLDTAVVTESYISPVGTPGASSFPTATVAQVTDSAYNYIRVTPSKSEALGAFALGSGIGSGAQVFSNPVTAMTYPLSFNQSFVDTGALSVSIGPGFTLGLTINQNATVDGSGTLVLPYGTFSNVLRIKNTITNTISSLFINSTSVEQNYSWYDPTTKFPLLTVSTTIESSGGTSTTSHRVSMRIPNVVSGVESSTAMLSTDVYPNPAQVNGTISVRTERRESVQIEVYDAMGKRIFEGLQTHPNGQPFEIVTQSWTGGVYLVRVIQGGYISTRKVVLE
jgi:hypothetical protein